MFILKPFDGIFSMSDGKYVTKVQISERNEENDNKINKTNKMKFQRKRSESKKASHETIITTGRKAKKAYGIVSVSFISK